MKDSANMNDRDFKTVDTQELLDEWKKAHDAHTAAMERDPKDLDPEEIARTFRDVQIVAGAMARRHNRGNYRPIR
jgi:hypothetical protein